MILPMWEKPIKWDNRVFHKLYENAIFIFTAWKQKNPVKKCYPEWE